MWRSFPAPAVETEVSSGFGPYEAYGCYQLWIVFMGASADSTQDGGWKERGDQASQLGAVVINDLLTVHFESP